MSTEVYVDPLYRKLLEKTRPAKTQSERDMYKLITAETPNVAHNYVEDNLLVTVPGDPHTMFTAHVDTANVRELPIKWSIDSHGIISTDGKSNLCADDSSGIYIMLVMIKARIPGLYLFCHSEEVGGIGSGDLAKSDFFKDRDIKRAIAFDRGSKDEIITHQGNRCASDTFANELATRLNGCSRGLKYMPSTLGIFTDTANFMELVPECTNIGVGYDSEHTVRETQDWYHLRALALACTEISWSTLPTTRDLDDFSTEKEHYQNWGRMYRMVSDAPELITDMLQDMGYDAYELQGELAEIQSQYDLQGEAA